MRIALRTLVFALLALGALSLISHDAYAGRGDRQKKSDSEQSDQCAASSGSSGWDKECDSVTSTSTFHALRSDPGEAAKPVDLWGVCRYVNNRSGKTVFIPFRSAKEWYAFVNNPPHGVYLQTCVSTKKVVIFSNNDCKNPQPVNLPGNCKKLDHNSVSCVLPYAQTDFDHKEKITVQFACSVKNHDCEGNVASWTQSVSVFFQAGCREDAQRWEQIGSPKYYTTAPAACTPARCGPAHNVAAASKPANGLCTSGTASSVAGSGPWNWECMSPDNGKDIYCNAPILGTNGQCGPAHNVAADTRPVDGLCTSGTATTVAGNGPWTWSCTGLYGGNTAQCQAPLRNDGQCGPANGVATDTKPASGLCSNGNASSVTGYGPWNWTCSTGAPGSSTANCSAPVTPTNGQCGPADGVAVSSKPTGGLCDAGKPSHVTGNGPWNWTCEGKHGGTDASCQAPVLSISGQCGPANGVTTDAKPTSGLCSAGTASTVMGDGPWTWTCSGIYGGNTVWCSAPITPVNGQCGSAHGSKVTSKPTTGLCNYGTASTVTGNGPWNWTCAGSGGGTTAQCSATLPGSNEVVFGRVCGTALSGVPGFGGVGYQACLGNSTNCAANSYSVGYNTVDTLGPNMDPANAAGRFCGSVSAADSSPDGAGVLFDLSGTLQGVTGSAMVVIPLNIWDGIRTQGEADAVLKNDDYASIPRAFSDLTMSYRNRPSAEFLVIPDVSQNASLAMDGPVTYVPCGKDCSNQPHLRVNYYAATKTLKVAFGKGGRWKKHWIFISPPANPPPVRGAWWQQYYIGVGNGKVWSQVRVVAPAPFIAPPQPQPVVQTQPVGGGGSGYDDGMMILQKF